MLLILIDLWLNLLKKLSLNKTKTKTSQNILNLCYEPDSRGVLPLPGSMPGGLGAVLTLRVLDSRSSAPFSWGRAHADALTYSVSVLLFLLPLSPSLSLLLWCVQKRKSSSSVHLMVSLACPPICSLHAACARLPATQTHSAMCVCFTHPHCMSVLCGQVWPVLPGGDHCPRSPSGLKSGHWNL